MPSRDLPGILERVFNGNSYVISGQGRLRDSHVDTDYHEAKDFFRKILCQL